MEEMKLMLAHLADKIEDLSGDVKQLRYVLIEGNGKPAMTTQVALQEQRIEQLETKETDKKLPRGVWLSMVISVIFGVAGLIAGFAS